MTDTPPAQDQAGQDRAAEDRVAESDRNDAGHARLAQRRQAALKRIDGDSSGILIDGVWQPFTGEAARRHYAGLDYRTGLAFSGGGIRSATIALGLSEAMAARGRLYGFDMMSTVSGGGYFGSFLRALHIPRGSAADEGEIITDRLALAEATMASLPDQQYFRGEPGQSAFVASGRAIKNPLWWLRENGRYLAPSGMSDYGFALAYIVRGWISLLVFTLAVALVGFALLQLVLLALVEVAFGWQGGVLERLAQQHLHSPLFAVLVVFGWIGAGIAGAYWLATPLSYSRMVSGKDDAGWTRVTVLGLLLAALLGWILVADACGWLPGDATAQAWAGGLKLALAAALLSAGTVMLHTRGSSHLDFRREQTRLLARFCIALIALAALTAIDWAALSLRLYFDTGRSGSPGEVVKTGALSGALASALSYLIAKLPEWLGGKESGVGRFLVDHARHFALAAALVILFAIALLADVLAIKLLWRGQAWVAANPIEWTVFGAVVGLVAFVALLFASSLNFANLLALTPFYGSRLTRTFMGGSNVRRLDSRFRSEVTQGLKDDDIALQTYMEADCAAPLHFVNVTRNRTMGEAIRRDEIDVPNDDPMVRESPNDPRGRLASYESGLTLHDRHGDRMVFGPFGLRVGAEFHDWQSLRDPPSLGLLCAISGAAVGAGMGRMTSLGTSMAFTLANIRLGYWWPEQTRPGETPPKRRLLPAVLPGLTCLTRELLGRFGTRDHWFLSDGGHSENTGVLTLLERGCRFIVASDNGQDETFTFADLEILIRTARTDIGMEVAVVAPTAFPKSLMPVADCFLNGVPGDWRAHARSRDSAGFALLLRASDIPRRVNGVWKRRRGGDAWIVWIKPKCFAGLPADIATYADQHADFPQQTTGNQFFDEAQWESYRRLGFEMGRRLFSRREPFDPFLPLIHPRSGVAGAPAGTPAGPGPGPGPGTGRT